jgi:hypothetical protein
VANTTTSVEVIAELTEGGPGLKDQSDIYVRALDGYRRRAALRLAVRTRLHGRRSTSAIVSVDHVSSVYVFRILLELWDDFFGQQPHRGDDPIIGNLAAIVHLQHYA